MIIVFPIIMIFLSSLFFSHLPILIVKRYQKGVIADPVTWGKRCEQLDYVYLILAVAGIIPAVFDILRHEAIRDLDNLSHRFVYLDNNDSILSTLVDNRSRIKDGKKYQKYLDYYNSISDTLKNAEYLFAYASHYFSIHDYDINIYNTLNRSIEAYQNAYAVAVPQLELADRETERIYDDARDIHRDILSSLSRAEQLLQAARRAEQVEAGGLFLRLGPILLVISLALRFAKTSGKLLLVAQKPLPQGTVTPPRPESTQVGVSVEGVTFTPTLFDVQTAPTPSATTSQEQVEPPVSVNPTPQGLGVQVEPPSP